MNRFGYKQAVRRFTPGAHCYHEPVFDARLWLVRAADGDRTELGRGPTPYEAWRSAFINLNLRAS